MSKTLFSLFTCIVMLAVLALTPFGVQGISDIQIKAQTAEDSKNAADDLLRDTQAQVVQTVNSFIDQRTFGVAYDDVSKLASVLSSIGGISVANVYDVDPAQNYVDIGFHKEGSSSSAVRFELVVENPFVALNAIDALQLAVVSIDYAAPNDMSVIALTGGDI